MISNKKQWTRKNSDSTNGDCNTMQRINTTNVGAQHRCTINDEDRKRDYQMLKWKNCQTHTKEESTKEKSYNCKSTQLEQPTRNRSKKNKGSDGRVSPGVEPAA